MDTLAHDTPTLVSRDAWRDARLFRIGGGTTETMRYYIAKLLGL